MKPKSPPLAVFLRPLPTRWPWTKVLMETVKTVLAGAIGVESCSDAKESEKLNPIYIIIAAIIFVVLFVFTLLTIVHIVTS